MFVRYLYLLSAFPSEIDLAMLATTKGTWSTWPLHEQEQIPYGVIAAQTVDPNTVCGSLVQHATVCGMSNVSLYDFPLGFFHRFPFVILTLHDVRVRLKYGERYSFRVWYRNSISKNVTDTLMW